MLAGVAPVTSASRIVVSASRYEDRLGSSSVADFLPARFSRLTENVAGRRGNTSCVKRPEYTASPRTIAPGHSDSELAAYATIWSYARVSDRFWLTQR